MHFLGIDNIHAVRSAFDSLAHTCSLHPGEANETSWGRLVEDSCWLQYVRLILSSSVRVAEVIHRDSITVLVHCSDGWDRTSQITALSMLLLDAHYRTVRGFRTLVEKEWIQMGHQFQLRHGHGDKNSSEPQRAPIFFQFLDCVWQLQNQFPAAFEFNGRMLLDLAHHVYSCRFGTFLGDCDAQRTEALRSQTLSLWAYIDGNASRYVNPFFSVQTLAAGPLLPPASIVSRNVTLWQDFFLRFSPTPSLASRYSWFAFLFFAAFVKPPPQPLACPNCLLPRHCSAARAIPSFRLGTARVNQP